MKLAIIFTTFIFPLFSLAGGGGGLRPSAARIIGDTEIVFSLGERDGVLKFAHGKLVDRQWQVQKIQVPTEFMADHDSLAKALETSKDLNQWVQIYKGN